MKDLLAQRSPSEEPAILIDIYPRAVGLTIESVKSSTATKELGSYALALPGETPEDLLPGDPETVIKELIEELGSLEDTNIVLGWQSDPFHPFEGKFDATLKVLECIARAKPKRLYLQTRSALIVIAMPVLQAISDRLTITISLETSQQHDLPRLEERIKAARALKRFGMSVMLQIGPKKRLDSDQLVENDGDTIAA